MFRRSPIPLLVLAGALALALAGCGGKDEPAAPVATGTLAELRERTGREYLDEVFRALVHSQGEELETPS